MAHAAWRRRRRGVSNTARLPCCGAEGGSGRQTGKAATLAGLDIRSVLTEAVRLHQAGQIEQAAALYRKVLSVDPNSADALHLLGMVALQQDQAASAAELIGKAIALHGREAAYYSH